MVLSATLLQNIKKNSNLSMKIYDTLHKYSRKKNSWKQFLKLQQYSCEVLEKRKKNSKSILQKFDIDIKKIGEDSDLYYVSPYIIEKRIMLLQELQVHKITTHLIYNFDRVMIMPVNHFKAYTFIDSSINISKNMLSYIKNLKTKHVNISELNNLSMREVYFEFISYYLKNELDFTEDAYKILRFKKNCCLYNSIRLISRLLKFLKNDLQLADSFITNNRWLLNYHPDQMKANIDILKNNLKDFNNNLIFKEPKILCLDPYDLQKYMLYLMEYKIPSQTIKKYCKVLTMNSARFKQRMKSLLNNPITSIFNKQPRFLFLVQNYKRTIRRIQYLQDKNEKYATVSLLTSHFDDEQKSLRKKKLNKIYVSNFLKIQFDTDLETLTQNIHKHPYSTYVPLLQMYETLSYLRQHFSETVIRKHLYSILYPKLAVQIAYETLGQECNILTPAQKLAFCIYKVEKKYNFSGEGVLYSEY